MTRFSSMLAVAERFTVKFEGPAVEDSTIDASVFGESLLTLANLIHDSRDIVAPDGPNYRVRVHATEPGSYEVALELRALWDAAAKLFTDKDAQAIAFLLAVFGKDGLFGFLLWLQGKRPLFQHMADGRLRVTVDDRETVIEGHVGNLFASAKVRKSVRKLAGHVKPDQIDKIGITLPGREPIEIVPENRSYLTVPTDDEKVTDDRSIVWLRLHTVRMESPKWAFRQLINKQLIHPAVLDEAWLQRFDRGEVPFHPHDTMECQLRTQQWDRDGEIETEHSIIKVLQVRTGEVGTQTTLMPPQVSDTPALPTRRDE